MFTWQFSSQKERHPQWYIVAIIVVLFLVVYGIFEGLYLMSVVAFLFAGVYILMENNSAPTVSVTVNDRVVQVGSSIYELDKIAKFTILSRDGTPALLRIWIKKSLTTTLDIPLTSEVDAYALKDFLSNHITYDSEAEFTKSDRIIEVMGL
ncbi:MAG: hypothetical protein PHY14_00055 [Candidatus Gracilibacteria bacterium]|nr:hypothetical protein [Candidatus Gracilibacteria bacterium]